MAGLDEQLEEMEAAEAKATFGRLRPLSGFWRAVFLAFTCIGIFLSVNQIFNLKLFINIVILDNSYLYLLLGVFFSLVFLVFPLRKADVQKPVPWYDAILFLIAISIAVYYAWNGLRSIENGWEYFAPPLPTYMAFVMWGMVMEGARRTGGLVIMFIFGTLSFYPIVAEAPWMPSAITGKASTFAETAAYHLMSEESVLGIPMNVFGTLIIGFIIFGVALQTTGGGRFFINLAFALLGGVRGGPAKVAIVASGLFGSLSGSVITNVLTTGSMTIPAMKKTGYPATYAGGIEACASTGGVLMPPVMGTTAFVMASFLEIPYIWVAIAAIVPSFLYFFGLFVQIDSYAARYGIQGMPKSELPSAMKTLKEGWYYIFAFFLLITLLVYLKREAQAPFFATAALLILSQFGKLKPNDIWFYVLAGTFIAFLGLVLLSVNFPPELVTLIPVGATILALIISHIPKHIRITPERIWDFFEQTGKLLAELVGILAAVGLIIGGVMGTGVAGAFSGELVRLAGGEVMLLLFMGALTSFLLGIGMTVTAAYIFLAIVLAPALIELGLDPIAVHLFILYWGMVSFITPPVALGAFAAATVAGASPMKTGLEAMRLGSVIYFLPFFFVLNPALVLNGALSEIIIETSTATLGVVLIASGMQGYLVLVGKLDSALGFLSRLLLVGAGLLLAYPEMQSNIIGLGVMIVAALIGRAGGGGRAVATAGS